MTRSRRYLGRCASDGTATGALYLAAPGPAVAAATPGQVREAFAAVAAERAALAGRLRDTGRGAEAEIVSVAALIAADPALEGAAITAMDAGADAATAVRQAAADQAAVIAALPSADLAERATDVRLVGVAVLEHLFGRAAIPPAGAFILVAGEVAAADLIELADHGLAGAVSVLGGASSHAAIVARGLGIPMITGVPAQVLAERDGRLAILDADGGLLVVEPTREDRAARATQSPAHATRQAPAGEVRTSDGVLITVQANVASAAETRLGLAAGAAGVGLIRTEIPFATATDWPSEAEHLAALTPILDLLDGRAATVRLLDFSGDKVPPFLRAADFSTGLDALLARPDALRAQLRAALRAGRQGSLALLVPMVTSIAEVAAVSDALDAIAAELQATRPRLGIMVEVQSTAEAAPRFARHADFFSIGTNDLTGQVLNLDRRNQAASPGLAADPQVLRLIDQIVRAAQAAGIGVSVCGDAAADQIVLPLLLGLGVRTVSVPAARVTRVTGWVSGWDSDACAAVAAKAVKAAALGEVQDLVRDELVS
jgi:phosphoenolpyruvate-protein kinase (PTS system EI component)